MIENIEVIQTIDELVGFYPQFDLTKDIIFAQPENSKDAISLSYGGSIKVSIGSDFNLSVVQNKFEGSSPFRIWKIASKLKFCMPFGVMPIFNKPTNDRSVVSTNVSLKQFVDVKILRNKHLKKTIHSQYSVIYQDISIETTTNKVILAEDRPTLIIPGSSTLFEIVPVKTYMSQTDYCGNIYLIKNDEFYYNFKESV